MKYSIMGKHNHIQISRLVENLPVGNHREDIKAGYYCFHEGMHLIS